LARAVDRYSWRLRVPERMTQEIADWLCDELAPRGVGVLVKAGSSQPCCTSPGLAPGRRPVMVELDSGLAAHRLRREIGDSTTRLPGFGRCRRRSARRSSYVVWVERDGAVLARAPV